MFLNIKSVLFFIFIICFKVCSLEFDDFRNELSIPERNEIASRCIMASFENDILELSSKIRNVIKV